MSEVKRNELDPTQCYVGSLWTHLKTAQLYVVIGFCRLEASNKTAVLYQPVNAACNYPWARDLDEFLDGRFERFTKGEIA